MAHVETEAYGAHASMELAGFTVELRVGDGGRRETLVSEQFVSVERDDFAIECSEGEESLAIAIVAKERIFVESCRVYLRHAQTYDEMITMNGYQSATETSEHSAWSRMKGLRLVPSKLVDALALDTAGDYRFAGYDPRSGNLHGYTFATFRRDEGVVLVASLDESHGFTLIRSDARQGRVILETEAPLSCIESGQRFELGRYAIVRGTAETVFARWAELAGMRARTTRTLIGFTSRHAQHEVCDEAALGNDLADMVHALGPGGSLVRAMAADVAQNTGRSIDDLRVPDPVFLIDEGYCTLGDWLAPDVERFDNGLAPLAAAARAFGFIPGVWLAPFVCGEDSTIAKEHPEWMLRDETGEKVRIATPGGIAFALDSRNADVRSYVLEVLQTFVRVWNFGLVKVDLLFAACITARDCMNRAELMADALSLIRQGIGEDCLMIAAGVPLASAFGVADFCQVACDAYPGISAEQVMFLTQRERPSMLNNLLATYARSGLDGRAFGNDPGVVYLRSGVFTSKGQRDERLFAAAELGSVFLTSDSVSTWPEDMRQRYSDAVRLFITRTK